MVRFEPGYQRRARLNYSTSDHSATMHGLLKTFLVSPRNVKLLMTKNVPQLRRENVLSLMRTKRRKNVTLSKNRLIQK